MKYLFILVILSSCAFSYYYRGKDLISNHKKNQKNIAKSMKQFDVLKQYDQVLVQLEKFNESKKITNDFKTALVLCRTEIDKIKMILKKRDDDFNALKIEKKKKYQEKDKKYKKIQTYINNVKLVNKQIETENEKIQTKCNKVSDILDQNSIKVLPVSEFKNSIIKTRKKLKKQIDKNKKQISKIRLYLKKKNHKNRNKILNHLNAVESIQSKLLTQFNKMDLILKRKELIDKKFIVLSPASPFQKDYDELNEIVSKYNQLVNKAKEHSNKIKKLM